MAPGVGGGVAASAGNARAASRFAETRRCARAPRPACAMAACAAWWRRRAWTWAWISPRSTRCCSWAVQGHRPPAATRRPGATSAGRVRPRRLHSHPCIGTGRMSRRRPPRAGARSTSKRGRHRGCAWTCWPCTASVARSEAASSPMRCLPKSARPTRLQCWIPRIGKACSDFIVQGGSALANSSRLPQGGARRGRRVRASPIAVSRCATTAPSRTISVATGSSARGFPARRRRSARWKSNSSAACAAAIASSSPAAWLELVRLEDMTAYVRLAKSGEVRCRADGRTPAIVGDSARHEDGRRAR